MSTVCVHGLGYIGLPTAAMMANYDHTVAGYDTDPDLRSRLRSGEIRLDEPGLRAFVTQAVESGRLEIVDEPTAAKYHVICVPTPFDEEALAADLGAVRAAGEAVADRLRRGDTVILESTVPPGTTTDVLGPILESGGGSGSEAESVRDGLTAGEDFALVHCPETVLPGNIITELTENDRIVGGVNGLSTESAVRLYGSFVDGEIRSVADPTVAEFVKLIQNTFRDVNIALANEVAKLAAEHGVDSRAAIELANAHPRVNLHQPGPGVGGHCLPIDPWFLAGDSAEADLIETARAVNDGMSGHVIRLLRAELGDLSGRTIAVLGAAYKPNVGDTRMSPGLKLARELRHGERERPAAAADGGAEPDPPEIAVHDPHVTDPTLDLVGLEAATADADAVVVATGHDEFAALDPEPVSERMAGGVAVDAVDVLDPDAWRDAGFSLRRI